jgi:hypothetical protein
MARFQTTVESVSIVDGQRQLRALNVRAVEPVPASPQAIAKGNLYVLLELGGSTVAQPAVYRLVLNAIQGAYYDAAGGITGGITEAILMAHQTLGDHNAVHPDEAQLGGVSCVVLRGEELYLGVGGPAMVLIGAPDRIDQFPGELSDAVNPLGGAEAPALELFRTNAAAGMRVIQLASEWVARVPMDKLATTAALADLATVTEYLEAIAPSRAALSALATHISRAPAAVEQPATRTAIPDETPAAETPEVELPVEAVVLDVAPAIADAAETPAEPELAGEPAGDTEMPPARRKRARRWLWPLLLLIPLAMVAAVAVGLWWQEQQLQQEFDSLMQSAQVALQAASDPALSAEVARVELAGAQEDVRQALVLFPNNDAAANLEADIQARLDEVNLIVPLYKLLTLQPLGGPGSEPEQLIVQGSRVFVGDTGLDRVLRYGLDEVSGLIPETAGGLVAERGQVLSDGQLVGELVDVAWGAAGGERRSSNLLILDSHRTLIEVDSATGLKPLVIADREQWVTPRAVEGFNGNFYLLDAGSGKVLRYRPTADGYSNAPDNYFEGDVAIDLSRAVDMAIDGNIWILYSDGTVQTFFQGRQQPFVLQPPPDGPITSPQAIYTGSAAGSAQTLYIVDSGASRIVEYNKNGEYLRQFRPADRADQEKLRRMRDLQVDELSRTFYILASDGLYRTDIPE